MRYVFSIFGKRFGKDLSPKDLVLNQCERILGEQENSYLDGYREKPIELKEYQDMVYRESVNGKEMYLQFDGCGFDIPIPKEVKFMGEEQIRAIAEAYFQENN